jgi:SHS2 domain-containing protein
LRSALLFTTLSVEIQGKGHMNSGPSFYDFINHTADLGIVVRGPHAEGLFTNAARAMTELMVEGDLGEKRSIREIFLDAEDYPDLMVRWLGEVLYLFDGEKLITDTIAFKALSATRLEALLSMAAFRPERHRILREIKAVTYHGISVERKDDLWEARVIFDI